MLIYFASFTYSSRLAKNDTATRFLSKATTHILEYIIATFDFCFSYICIFIYFGSTVLLYLYYFLLSFLIVGLAMNFPSKK